MRVPVGLSPSYLCRLSHTHITQWEMKHAMAFPNLVIQEASVWRGCKLGLRVCARERSLVERLCFLPRQTAMEWDISQSNVLTTLLATHVPHNTLLFAWLGAILNWPTSNTGQIARHCVCVCMCIMCVRQSTIQANNCLLPSSVYPLCLTCTPHSIDTRACFRTLRQFIPFSFSCMQYPTPEAHTHKPELVCLNFRFLLWSRLLHSIWLLDACTHVLCTRVCGRARATPTLFVRACACLSTSATAHLDQHICVMIWRNSRSACNFWFMMME